jgi:dephospho-CoA kinase
MSLARVGLTGGIGSGKSTVAQMFAGLAVPVLDLDQLGREIVSPGSKGLKKLISTFGGRFLQSDGCLNRAALAEYCFADADRTARLNGVMHPLIGEAEEQWLKKQSAESLYVVIEASVLLESGGASRMNVVLVVLAEERLRCQRVLARGDRDVEQFKAIVARQCTDDERRCMADIIIENNNSIDALKDSVLKLHEGFLKRFSS